MGRNPSVWWTHFKKIDKNSASCVYCDKVIVTSGNTSNLKGHFEAVHGSIIKTERENDKRKSTQIPWNLDQKRLKVDSAAGSSSTAANSSSSSTPGCGSVRSLSSKIPSKTNEISIKDCFESMKSFEEGGRKHTKLTNKILFMICKDSQPVATVEREGFKELMKHVAPSYKIPCRKTFGSRLDNKYEELSKDYKRFLKTVKDITLTTDLWSDTLNTRSFLGITAHFLQGSEIVSGVIGVYDFPTTHTSAHLEEKLRDVCNEWEINLDQISAIVTDNASNIVKAMEDFVGKDRHIGNSNLQRETWWSTSELINMATVGLRTVLCILY